MQISEIQILPVKPNKGLVAFASCIIDNNFFVGNIALFTKINGTDYRLVYPDKTISNGAKIHLFHPINKEAGLEIETAIINKYKELIENGNSDN